jgi:Reverse transcriptase (RNA-dependent DNA polymerase)
VVSPLRSNLYLDALDHHMDQIGFGITRYADDFVIQCQTEEAARAALEEVSRGCGKAKLTGSPTRTRFVHVSAAEGFDFLGYHFRLLLAAQRTEWLDIVMVCSLDDPWKRKLFLALCRRYGLNPYRERGQRSSAVQVLAPRKFLSVWPAAQRLCSIPLHAKYPWFAPSGAPAHRAGGASLAYQKRHHGFFAANVVAFGGGRRHASGSASGSSAMSA